MTSPLRDALVKARDAMRKADPLNKDYRGSHGRICASNAIYRALKEIDAALSTPTEEVTYTRASILEEAAKVADERADELMDVAREFLEEGEFPDADNFAERSAVAKRIAERIRSLANGDHT